ncbi:hypothetical protein AWB68_08045 [Caballeronia choica]|uniref:YhcG N-terminal domain-containing protein n=1 Tax=Caballeronia choica TaxID=326476 RepID=A0A158KZS0_9BURK|nr:hypothetical protein AWB68_08045 [Caballeronia choica]
MTSIALKNAEYLGVHNDIVALLERGRRAVARSVNALMTGTYWQIGRRIVEFEQGGQNRAAYGQALLGRLSADLTGQFGRGFGVDNLELMRLFYQTYPFETISESLIRKSASKGERSKSESVIRNLDPETVAAAFPLSWTHYIHLMRRTRSVEERAFYEAEALRGGWSVRQLDRQISSQFHTRAMLSKNKRAMVEKGSKVLPADLVTPEEAIKDPYVLEFLNLKDEYSGISVRGRTGSPTRRLLA